MNDFYVYGHYLVENDVLFYVGKGRNNRLNAINNRSKNWCSFTFNKLWYAKKIHENLAEDVAEKIEKELISTGDNLVNSKVSTNVAINIPLEITDYFKYSESSPTGLLWNKTILNYSGNVVASKDTPAGVKHYKSNGNPDCYRVSFRINGRRYRISSARVIWFLLNGQIPERMVIDHIDGNPFNNLITNLRMVTRRENSSNLKRNKNNKTGHNGILETRYGSYNAKIVCDNRVFQKSFAFLKFGGKEKALTLAKDWRDNKIKELQESGDIMFTDRHGIER